MCNTNLIITIIIEEVLDMKIVTKLLDLSSSQLFLENYLISLGVRFFNL